MEVVAWDSEPVLPVARAADPGRVGQHGLEIVMAISQGFEVQREPVGKRITARIALPDDPGGDFTGRHPSLNNPPRPWSAPSATTAAQDRCLKRLWGSAGWLRGQPGGRVCRV